MKTYLILGILVVFSGYFLAKNGKYLKVNLNGDGTTELKIALILFSGFFIVTLTILSLYIISW